MDSNIKTKVCSCCKKELPLSFFYRNKRITDGFSVYCKECESEKRRKRNQRSDIIENRRKRDRKYRQTEKSKQYRSLYHKSESYKKISKTYRESEKGKQTQRICNSRPERIRKDREYRKSEKCKEVWRKSATKRIKEGKNAELLRKRRRTNPNFKIQELLRGRLLREIKRRKFNKNSSALDLLGCSIDELKKYLEMQFEPGMTWDNHGENGWHIDHIIPCSYFDLKDPEQQRICFNYRNLQPLWKVDNIKKSNKVPDNVEELVEFLKQEIKNDT